jgi:hypothetical protein
MQNEGGQGRPQEILDFTLNKKKWWAIVKQIYGDNRSSIPTIVENDNSITDPAEKAVYLMIILLHKRNWLVQIILLLILNRFKLLNISLILLLHMKKFLY